VSHLANAIVLCKRFKVVSASRTFHLRARTEKEVERWIRNVANINGVKVDQDIVKFLTENAPLRKPKTIPSDDSRSVAQSSYLFKKGALNTSYKKRWFELRRDVLSYYENSSATKPNGIIDLVRCMLVTEPAINDNLGYYSKSIVHSDGMKEVNIEYMFAN